MKRLNPDKLHIKDMTGTASGALKLPRRYTLTHSDFSGDLFLTVGPDYEKRQVSGLYTRLMRDEVLAELAANDGRLELRLYCHVSGGLVIGTAGFRSGIFHAELPLVLEAIRYGDRKLFETEPDIDNTPIYVYFRSASQKYNTMENWGKAKDYR
ncbi:MAG: staygreen family protein [Dehalococcoidales bacterium]|nr:staygreen family protein [Dehalococcoidales bacterium]